MKQTKAQYKKSLNSGTSPIQLGLFAPVSNWRPTPVSELPSWKGVKRIAIDCEGKDPSIGNKMGSGSLRDGRTVGWSFAFDEGPKFYLPYGHEGGDNLPEEEVKRYLRENIKNFEGEYVGANLAYDMDYGYTDGFEWNPNAKFRDIQIADPLIYELHLSYSLDNIGKRRGVEAKEERILKEAAEAYGLDPKAGLWRLPARYVGTYAENDSTSPLEILRQQEKEISQNDLREIWDLETDVLPVLVRMRRRGVRIDFDKLQQIEDECIAQETELNNEVHRLTGINVGLDNFGNSAIVAPVLESLGMKIGKTSTGQPNVDKAVLGSLDHPVTTAISHARKINKLRTTFVESIRKFEINGRIHCTFRQIASENEEGEQRGVKYGRLASELPNVQQQPSPDRVQPNDPQIIKEWRKIYIPEEGAIWGCNDYSQQEPRWTTHFAAVLDLPKAAEAAERFRKDPSTDNHDMMTRIVNTDAVVDRWIREDPKGIYKIERGNAKAIFLGLCYGEGGPKLCKSLGKPTRWAHIRGWGSERTTEYYDTQREAMAARMEHMAGYYREVAGEEGQEILDRFDKEAPFVRKLAEAATDRANSVGFVRTILGRHLHFEMRDNGSYDKTHRALNRVIQGSSADQTKLAIVELDRAGYYLQLQVHDETDGSYGSVAEAVTAGEIMRDCITQRCSPLVPFKVDTETGPSWGEIK